MSENSTLVEHDKELETLRRENKKISRLLAAAQDIINRNKLLAGTTAALHSIIENEKFNQDIFFNLILKRHHF